MNAHAQTSLRTDLFICFHIMLQTSFQNSKGQKGYHKFLGVRSELLLSIIVWLEATESHVCIILLYLYFHCESLNEPLHKRRVHSFMNTID